MLSPIVRPLNSHPYRQSNSALPILQEDHISYPTVGQHDAQPELQHLLGQGTSDTLLIVRVFGHTSEEQENAVLSALRQDMFDPLADLSSLSGKRVWHFKRTEILQPTQQAKLPKQSGSVGTAAPLAAIPSDAAAAHVCNIQGFNASKLAGYRGDAMVARRDALVVQRSDHIGLVPNGGGD